MIEPKAVAWAIEVMRAMVPENIPAEWQIVAFDRQPKADSSRIIVKAKSGEQELEGAQAFPVTITVDIYATEKWVNELETIATAAQSSFTDKGNGALVNAGTDSFSYLDLIGTASDEPDTRKKSRHRSFSVELKALEK